MAASVSAAGKGIDYQLLLTWLWLLELLDEAGPQIKYIGLEEASAKPADDIVIVRTRDSHRPSEFWQVKYHVSHAKTYTYSSLARRGARGQPSLLAGLRSAWLRCKPAHSELLVGLVSNWQLDSRDPLRLLLSDEFRISPRLAGASTPRAQTIARAWRDHLGCDLAQLAEFLAALQLRLGMPSKRDLLDQVGWRMRAFRLQSDRGAVLRAVELVKGWLAEDDRRITVDRLERAIDREGLRAARDPRPLPGNLSAKASAQLQDATELLRAIEGVPGGGATTAGPTPAMLRLRRRLERLQQAGRSRVVVDLVRQERQRRGRASNPAFRYLFAASTGHALRAMGRREDAARSFGRALRIAPQRAQANANVAIVAYELDRRSAAQLSAETALALESTNAAALQILALLRADSGDKAGARQLLNQIEDEETRLLADADIAAAANDTQRVAAALKRALRIRRRPHTLVRLARHVVSSDLRPSPHALTVPWAPSSKAGFLRGRHALALADEAVVSLRATRSEDELADALILRAMLRRYLGTPRPDDDVFEACLVAPDNPHVASNAIRYWLEIGKADNALALLEVYRKRTGLVPDWARLFARALMIAGRNTELVAFTGTPAFARIEKPERTIMRAEAYYLGRDYERALAALKGISEDGANVRVAIQRALALEGLGKPEPAVVHLRMAAAAGAPRDRWRALLVLGSVFSRQGLWAEAIGAYEPIYSPTAMPEVVAAYLVALYNADRLGDCILHGRAVWQRQGVDASWGHVMVASLDVLGHFHEAERFCRDWIRTDPASNLARCELARVLFHLGRHKEALSSMPQPVDAARLPFHAAERAAEVMLLMGATRDAVTTAFLTLQRHVADADAHLLFLKIMFNSEGKDKSFFAPTLVGPGVLVEVEVSGRVSRLDLLPRDAIVLAPHQHLPASEVGRALTGAAVGDTVSIRRDGRAVSGVVKALDSLYVATYKDVLSAFPTRFPERNDVEVVPVDDALVGRLRASTAELERRAEAVRDFYTRELPPLGQLAQALKSSSIQVWYGLISGELNSYVEVARQTPREEDDLVSVAAAAQALVLCGTSLLAFGEWDALDAVAASGTRLIVAPGALGELEEELYLRERAGIVQTGRILSRGGQMSIAMVSKGQAAGASRLFRRVIEWTRRNCELVAVPAERGNGIRSASEALGRGAFESVIVAASTDAVLVTEDRGLRQVAKRWKQIDGSMALSVLGAEVVAGRLPARSLEKARAIALSWGYVHIGVTVDAVRTAIQLDGGSVGTTTRRVLSSLERGWVPSADVISVVLGVLEAEETEGDLGRIRELVEAIRTALGRRYRGQVDWVAVRSGVLAACSWGERTRAVID